MYTGRVSCCRLVSHVEYAPRPVKVRKKYVTDRQADGQHNKDKTKFIVIVRHSDHTVQKNHDKN